MLPAVESLMAVSAFVACWRVSRAAPEPPQEASSCGEVCVTKCCYGDAVMDMQSDTYCSEGGFAAEPWHPVDLGLTTPGGGVGIRYGFPPFNNTNYTCLQYFGDEFSFLADGSLVVQTTTDYQVPNHLYCVDKIIQGSSSETTIAACVCLPQDHPTLKKPRLDQLFGQVLLGAQIVSCLFLTGVLFLYALAPLEADLQKKCTLSSCVGLFLALALNVVNMTPVIDSITKGQCVALALFIQYFFLAFFFWLNVMCYEIYRVIRGTFNMVLITDLTKAQGKRFLLYNLYGWGSPLLVTSVTAAMQHLPEELPPSLERFILRPRIGETRCWFREEGFAIYAYHYNIEIFLHLLNGGFMCYTLYLFHREKLMCVGRRSPLPKPLRTHASKNHLELFKQQLLIYLLYLVIWAFDCISLIYSNENFWKPINLFLSLQGVFIFFIVIRTNKYAIVVNVYHRLVNISEELSSKVEQGMKSNKTGQ